MNKQNFMCHNATANEIKFEDPMILYMIFRKFHPDTIVELDAIEEKLEMARLVDFSNDVDDLLISMQVNFIILQKNGQESRKYCNFLLNALKTDPN